MISLDSIKEAAKSFTYVDMKKDDKGEIYRFKHNEYPEYHVHVSLGTYDDLWYVDSRLPDVFYKFIKETGGLWK